MRPSLPLVPVLLSAAALVPAVEAANGFHDLRAGWTFLDQSYDATRDDGISRDAIDRDWDNVHRGFVGYFGGFGGTPFGGLAYGVDLAADFRDVDGDDGDADIEYEAFGAHVYLGWAAPIGDVLQLELLPFFGAGAAELKRTLPGGTSTKDNETLIEFGAVLNAIVLLGRFEVGAQLGYLITDNRYNLQDAADSRDYDFGEGDVMGSVMIGFRVF